MTKRQAAKPAGISEKVIRLLEIYTMIAQKHYPSVPFLKEHFRVSERTVYRYLELINLIGVSSSIRSGRAMPSRTETA